MVARTSTRNNLAGDVEPVEQAAPSQPKVVLFGDSISSAVGYGQDSNADTRYGQTVAEMLSKQWGVPVDSQAMGGVTTKDALTGSAIPFAGKELPIAYGNYEKYLKEQRPNVVLLRFGAADAIRLNDPAQTLSNVQAMVDMAKSYGATPVVIGVSPFAAGGDSRAGNINAGSIDPFIESANAINQGLQAIAQQNDLPFVDVRSLEVPKGALLDGVHPTAEFGKAMAEHIGNTLSAAMPQFGNTSATQAPTKRTQAAPAATDGSASGLLSVAPAALTPEQWQRILSGEAMSIGDAYYTAERTGANASMDQWDEGTLTGRVMRVPVSGNQYQMLDSAGNVEQTLEGYRSKGFFGDLLSHAGSIAKDTAPVWLAALGANYLAPGAAGAAEAAGAAGSGAGAAGGTAAAAAPITDAATAAFLEANMGALAPTVSGGFAPAAAASTLAPEVIASTLAPETAAPSLLSTAAAATPELAAVSPELAGSGLLSPQTITVTGSRAAATTPWWAPAAVTAAAVPVLGGMTATPTVAEAYRPSQNYGEGMTGAQTSAYDGVINATGNPALANAAANVAGAGSSVVDFLKANPTLGRLLFSGAGALLNAVGGPSGSSPGGYVDSGYRPTISRGGFNPAPQARQMAAQPTGLLMPSQPTGQANSGLWRYANAGNPASNMAMSAVTLPKTIGAATAGGSTGLLSSAPPAALPSLANAPRTSGLSALANLTPQALPTQAPTMTSAYSAPSIRAQNAPAPSQTLSQNAQTAGPNGANAAARITSGSTFAGGQALNQQYRDLVKRELGFDLPDLSPYTGQYLSQYMAELATPQSRAGLINAMRSAQAQEAAGGYYQPGDLAPVITGPGANANPSDWWNKNYNAVFGNGNSYFLPDTSEVTFIPREVLGAFRKTGETDEQVHNRLYYGNRFLGSGRSDTSQTPEYSMRKLMNPTEADNPYNLLRENAGNLVSFDVGRGDLTYDQGYATSRLLEAKGLYDTWNRTLDQYKGDAAALQRELADFKAPTGWAASEANLAQLKADKQASLERLNAQIASGNPFADFYNQQMTAAKTIDPAKYSSLSSGAVLRAGLLGG